MVTVKGFKKVEHKLIRRVIMSVEGLLGAGKNFFAFSAPGPIAFIDLDDNSEDTLLKFAKKEILHHKVDLPFNFQHDGDIDPTDKEFSIGDYQRAFKDLCAAYNAALEHPEVRTIVVDTGTEVYELVRMAKFGRLANVTPFHYGPVNAKMKEFFRAHKKYPHAKNVIWLHKLGKQYKDDSWTGKLDMDGFKDVPYLSQIVLRMGFDKTMVIPDAFSCEVMKCHPNKEMEGEIYEGRDCQFWKIMSTAFPNSEPEDWM